MRAGLPKGLAGAAQVLLLTSAAVILVGWSDQAAAQTSDACYTQFGVCRIYPLQAIGSYCECYGDPGHVNWPPPPPPEEQGLLSTFCETDIGDCDVAPGPVGSPCRCYGDPGVRR